MNEDLVRCKPCGYVMKKSDLKDVCPACGMPHTAFEPYRDRVSANRKFILSLDIHPIAIHLSQTFVGLIPLLIIVDFIFPTFQTNMIHSVIDFCIVVFPLSLVASAVSGIVDGMTRFKTLRTPFLKLKLYISYLIFTLSIVMFFIHKPGEYSLLLFLLSLASMACAVILGLWGKKMLDVILPGSFILQKRKNRRPPHPHKIPVHEKK